MTRLHAFMLAASAALAAFALAACGGRTACADARTDSLTAALKAADDSVAVNSPYALDMINEGMATAADSLDYYDWYLRLMRYSVQRDVPDTASLRWRQASRFLSECRRTPRVDGMTAFLLNAKGSYYYKLHFEPGKAVNAYSKAYTLLFGSDSEYRLPDVCANLGDAYVAANDMPRAAWWYRRALFLADSLGLPEKDYASLYMGLGRIYLNLGDFDLAGSCYRTADEKIDLLPLNMQLYFLNNYGNYYYYKGDYRGAGIRFWTRGMYEKAREMFVLSKDRSLIDLMDAATGKGGRLDYAIVDYFTEIDDPAARQLILETLNEDLNDLKTDDKKVFTALRRIRSKYGQRRN